jgi:glycosyltransferase involved in cell wall biosynthesis
VTVTLSIVIPVYNGAGFIAKTVTACLQQTYWQAEVLVVNDGSSDSTLAELAQFGDAIRIINIPNGGVSNARNVGVEASSGDYIAFLDADDLWYPHKLERQMAAMLAYPDIGFSCSNYVSQYVSGKITRHFDQFSEEPLIVLDQPIDKERALRALIKFNFVGTSSNVIVRRSLLSQVGGFDTTLRQAEDYDLWLRFTLYTRFLLISDVLLIKVIHGTNLTGNVLETWQSHEKVLVKLYQSAAIAERPELRPAVKNELATVRYIIGNCLFNRGLPHYGFNYYLAGLSASYSPRNWIIFVGHAVRKIARLSLELLKLRMPFRDSNTGPR